MTSTVVTTAIADPRGRLETPQAAAGRHVIRATDIDALARPLAHRWNPASQVSVAFLAQQAGLSRTGLNLARLAPGSESFLPHAHLCEEEWLYVLSGRGVLLIDAHEVEIGAGDFAAFPAPSVVHHLRNPFAEPLVYLMGGEHREVEVEDFPGVGKRTIRQGAQVIVHDLHDARLFADDTPPRTPD